MDYELRQELLARVEAYRMGVSDSGEDGPGQTALLRLVDSLIRCMKDNAVTSSLLESLELSGKIGFRSFFFDIAKAWGLVAEQESKEA